MTLLVKTGMITLLGDYIACFDSHQQKSHIFVLKLLLLLQALLSGELLEETLSLLHTASSTSVLWTVLNLFH